MWHRTHRGLLAIALAAFAGIASAQQPPAQPPKPKDRDDYPLTFHRPETVGEFWHAIKFEIDVGEYEVAAKFLQGLLDKKPTTAEWLQLEEKEGTSSFLRLRLVPKWSSDAAKDKKAKENVEEIIKQVSDTLKKHLEDPARIQKYVRNLTASPEEREYALRELYKSGALVIPALVDALRSAESEDRLALKSVLPLLGPETVPPLLAGLDSGDALLQLDILQAIRTRKDKRVVPWLWYLSADKRVVPTVRKAATDMLAVFMEMEASKLPPARAMLTAAAENYYQHRAEFADPKAVVIWRWDPTARKIVAGWPNAPTVTASQAEEYYGDRYARQALDLDPGYAPAQLVFLSLALDKATERVGYDTPLAKADAAAAANQMVTTVNPDLLVAALERALDEKRVSVILATTRALGDLGEVRAIRPTTASEPALVRALNFPERRVQMAAAEALLRIPSIPSAAASVRVMEVLRRTLAAEPDKAPVAKVLIGYDNQAFATEISFNLRKAGYEAVVVHTGRDVLRRLHQAADIDLLLIDAGLPEPGLASLLGQLRADVFAGRLPLVLTVAAEKDKRLNELGQLYRDESKRLEETHRLQEKFETEKLTALSARYAKEAQDREARLRELGEQYRIGSQKAEEALRRFVERSPNTFVVQADLPLYPDKLKQMVQERLARADTPPLPPAVVKDYAERSIAWLARIAKGEIPGYSLRSSPEMADTLLSAVQSSPLSEQGLSAALEIAGRLPGTRVQTALTAFLLDDKRSAKLREQAAKELVRHMQQHGTTLTEGEVGALRDFADKADRTLKPHVTLVLGALRPGAVVTGDRLRQYAPPTPGVVPVPRVPAPPPPPKP